MLTKPLYRRTALKLLASVSALPLISPLMAQAQSGTGIDFIVMADLHSAYERTGQLLDAVEQHIAQSANPCVILINGDLFESGNVVATRSQGEIDWAFLKALSEAAPVVFNIGNHEADLDNDLAHFVARAEELGVMVITNITDTRTGTLYAPSSATLEIGGQQVNLIGLGVNALGTYPEATREQLSIPEPTAWAAQNLPSLIKDKHINVVMSHAGVMPDKTILADIADGTFMIGGHDHLNITHEQGNTRYLHTGWWSDAATIATIAGPNQPAEFKRLSIDANAKMSSKLGALIPAVLEKHLSDEDREVIGTTKAARNADEAGQFVAASMAAKLGGDIGFIGHTTFGAGLPEGDVSRYAFNSSVRFDGKLATTEVDADVLHEILKHCNQFGDFAFADRTGDYLYAAPLPLEDKARYTLVCNGWSAMNQKSYFGREDLEFTNVDDVLVKQTTIDAMA